MAKLADIATIVRSKNAEPFMTTIDIYFSGPEKYRRLKESGALTVDRVAELYRIPPEAVYGVYFIDAVDAAKVTLYKYNDGAFRGLGDPEVADMYGAQVYVPLLDLEVDS
jgi:hypothetical protein